MPVDLTSELLFAEHGIMSDDTPSDASERRKLLHELAEALTAAGAFLAGCQRSDDAGRQREGIDKAAAQIGRADRIVARLRSLTH